MRSGLVVQDLSMNFGGIRALDHITFEVGGGTICGLIGPNGAGKTTLFNCISRVYQPSSGSVRMDDLELLDLPAHKIAGHGVARTFQNLGLFAGMTILDNVMAGAHPHLRTGFVRAITRWGVRQEDNQTRREAFAILQRLDLHELAFHPAADLPFGTLKRVELARALMVRPRLILLDEPAGGLTHGEVDELADDIRKIQSEFEVTVLLVEHHMRMVMKLAEKLVAMDNGVLIAQGEPDAVRNDPAVVSAYLGRSE